MDCNKGEMKEGLVVSINEYVTNILPMQIAIEGHIARVIDAMSSVKLALDILNDRTVKTRKVILQIPASFPACWLVLACKFTPPSPKILSLLSPEKSVTAKFA